MDGGAEHPEPESELAEQVAEHLGLRHCTVQPISIVPTADPVGNRIARARVWLDGRQEELVLQERSVRAAHFRLLLDEGDGQLREVEPPPATTYSGSLDGQPATRVSASIFDGQLTALVDAGNGRQWGIQPVPQELNPSTESMHVVYASEDILPRDETCGVNESFSEEHIHSMEAALAGAESGNGGGGTGDEQGLSVPSPGTFVAELAIDADYEFYTKNGSSLDASVADIEQLLNGVNLMYERDLGIAHLLSALIVRTAEEDPYTSTDSHALLNEFQGEWNANHSDLERDVAHLLTGKGLDSFAGLAYVGVVCSPSSSYGLSQNTPATAYNYRVATMAHELGHNWNALHCGCNIMCVAIGGCSSSLTEFSPASIATITAYRDSRSCLAVVPAASPDLVLSQTVAPEFPVIGDDLTYTITVQNQGSAQATSGTLQSALPAGVAYVASHPSGNWSGDELTWSLGDLDSGSSIEVTLTVRPSGPGVLTNVVTATSDDVIDLNPDDNVSVLVSEVLRLIGVSPQDTWTPMGVKGGPFDPLCQTYTLVNNALSPMDFEVAASEAWLDIQADSGSLAPGATVSLTVCINDAASGLPNGIHTGSVDIFNVTAGTSQSLPVELQVNASATLPFLEDFEGSTLEAYWEITGTAEYRTQVSSANGPHGGSRHLTLDDNIHASAYSRNEATLRVNAAGHQNLELRFWAKGFDEEPHGPPPVPFTDGADFDGVAISGDGVHWYEVQSLRSLDASYSEFVVDLDAATETYGLSLAPGLLIRFNQYDNYGIDFDGIAIDDISITGTPADDGGGSFTVPPDVTVSCSMDTSPSATGSATASYECGSPATIEHSDNVEPGPCAHEWSITRIWTATDGCGHSDTGTQRITVVDTTPPVLPVPGDVTIDCDGDSSPDVTGMAAASDNCDPVPSLTYSDSVDSGECSLATVITRTWSATDACGNTVSRSQTITMLDNVPPSLAAPADVTVPYGASTEPVHIGKADATDTCDPNPVVEFSDQVSPGACPAVAVITRTWTATDHCGNSSSAIQIVTVEDSTPPALTVPADVTIHCGESTDPGHTGRATAVDDFARTGSGEFDISGYLVKQHNVSKQFAIPDGTVISSGSYLIIARNKDRAEFESYWGVSLGPEVVFLNSQRELPWVNGGETYELLDPAGQVVDGVTAEALTENHSVQRVDTTLDATEPASWFSVEEGLATPGSGATGNGTAGLVVNEYSDASGDQQSEYLEIYFDDAGAGGGPTLSYTDAVTGTCPEGMILTRTWTATDHCGNTSSDQQMITVHGSSLLPGVAPPSDITIACDDDSSSTNTGVAAAEGLCGEPPIITEHDQMAAGPCGAAMIITRTWTASDHCGSTSADQVITIVDTTAPTLSCPPDVTVECAASTQPDVTGTATATDNCDTGVKVSFRDSASGGTVVRTWTAVDDCGNSSQCEQTIAIQDSAPPVLICPPDATVACDADSSPGSLGTATATDACDPAPVVSSTDTISVGPCPDEGSVTRTWTAIDSAGNRATCHQLITVVNGTGPELTVPADVTVECGESTHPDATGWATTTGGGGSAAGAERDLSGYQVRQYTASRHFNVPAGTWVEPGGYVIVARNADREAFESFWNMSLGPEVVFLDAGAQLPAIDGDETFELLDETGARLDGMTGQEGVAGHSVQRIDATLDAAESGSWNVVEEGLATPGSGAGGNGSGKLVISEYADAQDAGNEYVELYYDAGSSGEPVSVTYTDQVSGGCPEGMLVTRTWTATDTQGRSSHVVQIITVRAVSSPSDSDGNGSGPSDPCCDGEGAGTASDTTAPVLTVPLDVTLPCDADAASTNTGVATASDNCDSQPLVTQSDQVEMGNCADAVTIVRTWMATDTCGNTATANQVITLLDTTTPTFTVPPDVTVDCGSETTPVRTGDVTDEWDNCATGLEATFTDSVSGSCPGVITRTWTLTDDCGNQTSQQQTITVEDGTGPELTVPADVTVECGESTHPDATGWATTAGGEGSAAAAERDLSGYQVRQYTASRHFNVPAGTWVEPGGYVIIARNADREAFESFWHVSLGAEVVFLDAGVKLPAINGDETFELLDKTGARLDGMTGQEGVAGHSVQRIDATLDAAEPGSWIVVEEGLATPGSGAGGNGSGKLVISEYADAQDAGNEYVELYYDGGSGAEPASVTYSDEVSGGCPEGMLVTRTWTATDPQGRSSHAVQLITVHAAASALDADADRDGLPDAWEQEQLGSTLGSAGADPDRDGVNNLEEYVAGTDPMDADSYLMVRIAFSPEGCNVTFPSSTNVLYTVERQTDSGSGEWEIIRSDVPGGEGTTSISEPALAAGCFYRVRARLP